MLLLDEYAYASGLWDLLLFELAVEMGSGLPVQLVIATDSPNVTAARLRRLASRIAVDHVELGPLRDDEVQRFAAERLGNPIEDWLAEVLYVRAGYGIPVFVEGHLEEWIDARVPSGDGGMRPVLVLDETTGTWRVTADDRRSLVFAQS